MQEECVRLMTEEEVGWVGLGWIRWEGWNGMGWAGRDVLMWHGTGYDTMGRVDRWKTAKVGELFLERADE